MKEIELKSVGKLYKPDITALEDVSLGIARGEFVFITGRSGSGKSTLLKLLSGQILASFGEVWVQNKNLAELSRRELQQFQLQFGIMQPGYNLSESKTVRHNIEQAVRSVSPANLLAGKRADQALEMVGIPNVGKRYPDELSGGETVRALLARALAVNPRYLVLDDPTALLNSSDALDMMRLLKEVNSRGVTVIVSSHDKELVNIVKRRVITLSAGVKVSDENNATYNTMANDVFEERTIRERRAQRKLEKK
ncbi:MAG: ATP-binding cassette domain-containing protein [Lachnospiraceae bacterium]|nr:ATP-binding cassette domain-containing protein [Lachnospiraceae bacterium]